jgi:hypothetical protein
MANGNTSPSRVGFVNGASDGSFAQDNALFLKVFSGEILTTFEESNIMKDLHTVRTISSGKTAQFPATGVATATYHTAGENIADAGNSYLSDIKKNEITINIDDVLLASTFLANIDELKNHYDIRSIYAQELGKALAKRFDIAVMKTLIAGARQAATITGGNGGTQLTSGIDLTTGTGLLNALFEMAENLDQKDVPSEDRYAILTPAQYYKLISDPSTNIALNRDYGGEGSVAQGSVPMVAGISIYKSNHLTDITALGDDSAVATGDGASNNDVFGTGGTGYNGDFTTAGTGGRIVGGHKAGIGTVKLLDLATESEYQIERQGTLFVAKYAMGHGVIRPECCVEMIDQ